jgi:hypothetical protein
MLFRSFAICYCVVYKTQKLSTIATNILKKTTKHNYYYIVYIVFAKLYGENIIFHLNIETL